MVTGLRDLVVGVEGIYRFACCFCSCFAVSFDACCVVLVMLRCLVLFELLCFGVLFGDVLGVGCKNGDFWSFILICWCIVVGACRMFCI